MKVCCCSRRGDLKKCIPFYIVGAVLLIAGIPMMIAGIVGGFNYADFIGYVGGISIFFGVLFLFVWHMITIPNLDKMKTSWEDLSSKEATKETLATTKAGQSSAFDNLAFEKENSFIPGANTYSAVTTQSKSNSISSSNSNRSESTNFNIFQAQQNNSNNVQSIENGALYNSQRELPTAGIAFISGTEVAYSSPGKIT